jgi:PAS domain S-box-containing protein
MLSEVPMPGGRYYSAFVRDASERRKNEEALARERNFITAVLDNAGALCVVLDHDGRIIRFNRACEELTDYSQGEIKGRYLWDVIALPEDSQRVEEEVRGVLKGGFPARSESIWVTRRNNRRLVAWTHTALADSFGRLEYLVSIGADITAKRAMENQLAHARRMEAVGRLAGGIAHDFNNLLTAITGYSELVLHTLGEHDPVRKDIEEIRKAGERASALTHQLLAFSRKQVLMTRVFDLNAVVLDMEHMLRRLVGEAIELEVALCAAPAWIHADPSQMGQVLLNLVVNARDAISTGGAIHIATAHVTLDSPLTLPEQTVQPGSYVEFRVSDTGCGMDPETMAHAFEPFFTTKDSGRGTGLGLSTVYGIVSQSGGAISVSSEIGDGSTFRVYLPESPAPDNSAQCAGTAGQKTSA